MIGSDVFIEYPYELLSYMREQRMPVFHNSNIFFRDLQYAIKDYFEDKEGVTIRSDLATELAGEVARAYERTGIFKRVNPQGYLLNYPELITPKDGGTIAALAGLTPDAMPPPKAAAAPKPAPAAKPASAPKPASAAKPAGTASAPAAGAVPAGAKGGTPPWLKK